MGKKGSKRKTRWRTLSIGAPPGEEDEEDGLQNGYVKVQENDTGTHSFDRHGQREYKPRRTATGSGGTGGYDGNGARSHKDESSGLQSQPKIIFNEGEYTRITTPRQDVLFKKGYLSRKKPWAGNASTSATPSTTESQSASHSTAGRDGSETTEDQQFMDRGSGSGENPPVAQSGPQLGYGTFYDHASGYYYEYPVMLVGPAPVPAQVGPSVLAAVPCGPIPLRPIEWINPAFVPKLTTHPYCVMDYQPVQTAENTVVLEEQEIASLPVENSNGTCGESVTGSASCNGSVADETEEQLADTIVTKENETDNEYVEDHCAEEQRVEEHQVEEHCLEEHQVDELYANEQVVKGQPLENGINGGTYFEPDLIQQPVHVSHVIPAVPQPYMYPGHYMFGPPLVNVNGVTIQSGPMLRTTDIAAMTAACAKRRRKRKRKKQRRPVVGNTEDEEDEEEYSSECDTGLPSSRLPWTACPTSTTTTTTAINRPLNPECQEFQLRTVVEPHTSLTIVPTSDNTPTFEESSPADQSSTLSLDGIASINRNNEVCNGDVSDDTKAQDDELTKDNNPNQSIKLSLESSQFTSLKTGDLDNEMNRLRNCHAENENALSTNETIEIAGGAQTENEAPQSTVLKTIANDLSNAKETCKRPKSEFNGISASSKGSPELSEITIANGNIDSDSNSDETKACTAFLITATTSRSPSPYKDDKNLEKMLSRSSTPMSISTQNAELHRVQENHDPSSNVKSSAAFPKRKYSSKGLKFVREPTPGPDLDDVTSADAENEKVTVCDITQTFDKIDLSNGSYSKLDNGTVIESLEKTEDKRANDFVSETVCNNRVKDAVLNDEVIEGSNEDSGFESQTRHSDYPITEAVTEWLRRVNSPDMFVTSTISSESDTEDEDELNPKPPKNLQGNPMPALSANTDADNVKLSRPTSCGEFARASNIKIDQVESTGGSALSRKKRDGKCTKRRSGERMGRRVRPIDEKLQNELVSSSDSCSQRKDSFNTARKKNLSKQDVDDVCEFTDKDSVAGMRVASNSRMDSKRVNVRRTKRQGKGCNRDTTENIEMKIRRIEDADNEKDEGIDADAVCVRTFEKGEIIVTEKGRLLTTTSHETILYNSHDASTVIKAVCKAEACNEVTQEVEYVERDSTGDEEQTSAIISLGNIDEPDVLECWEAETIEPVITPKRMQSRGILCEGEAAEEDNLETDAVNLDYVQKYYRLARDSATSIEDESSESKTNIGSSISRTVPNNSEQLIESFCSEEIPGLSNENQKGDVGVDNIPIEEAFEVYESCYTGKTRFLIDSKVFKPRTLYGQDAENPIPCKAVCCNLQ